MSLDMHDQKTLDLGSDFGDWSYYVEDNEEVRVTLREDTHFHEERLDRDLDSNDLHELIKVIAAGTFQEPNDMWAEFIGDDTFEVSATYEADTVDELLEKAWDFIARTENVLDPGSFGSPYAFPFREEN